MLTLKFATLPAPLAFSKFFVRYQGVSTPTAQGLSAAGVATCMGTGCDDHVSRAVPEPATLALWGAGLVAASYLRGRRRR
jgi:hypothetical protein